ARHIFAVPQACFPVKIRRLAPPLDRHLAKFALFRQFGDTLTRRTDWHAVVISQIGGGTHAASPGCPSHQLTISILGTEVSAEMLGWNRAIRQVIGACEIRLPCRDCQQATPEPRLQHSPLDRTDPGPRNAPELGAVDTGSHLEIEQLVSSQRPVRTNLLKHS